MPKIIKKKVAKKKPVQENEVKSATLQALDALKKRQKQAIIAISAVVMIVILYTAFSVYSSSISKKAYSFEREAYSYYYAENIDKDISEKDRWKKAMELYQKSVNEKMTPTAQYYLGNCYFNLGDYDNAIKEYNVFVKKFKREKGVLPLVYQKLASAYFKSGKNDKAVETLDKLTGVDSGVFRDTALILEARHYEKIGESEKALEKYRQISTEFPASPWSAEANVKISAEEAKKSSEEKDGEEISEESEVKKEDVPAEKIKDTEAQ
jgi:tetratricopeptide (TPR) repeat protein